MTPADVIADHHLYDSVIYLMGAMILSLVLVIRYLEFHLDKGCAHCEHCQRRVREREAEQARLAAEYAKKWGLDPQVEPRATGAPGREERDEGRGDPEG